MSQFAKWMWLCVVFYLIYLGLLVASGYLVRR